MEHRQANLELARTYGLLTGGEQSLLLSDLEVLKAKEIQSIPLTYFELERNLGMFGNLLGTVLGSTHILTTRYREFWVMLSQGYRLEIQQIIDNKRYIKPAHFLRSMQLQCFNWFYQKRARLPPVHPDFTTMLHNMVLNTYILPHLPPSLYKLVYPKQPSTSGTPSLTSTQHSSSSSATITLRSMVSSLGNTITSSPSGLTIPTETNTRQRGTHYANINPDTTLLQLIQPGTKVRNLIGDTPPPLLDNGQQPCLSYLLRGGCWSTCRRAATNGHILTDAETVRLRQYLREQQQKLGGAPAPPP
jgi:hypothetical protein